MFTALMRGDLRRNAVTSLALLILISVATALVAAGAATVSTVFGSLDRLFDRAMVPHALQMHDGKLDPDRIHAWVAERDDVEATQVLPSYPLPVDALVIGVTPQSDSTLEPAAVAQSPDFDFLLGTDNEILDVSPGTVAMPFAYAGLVEVGGTISVELDGELRTFEVTSFLRDAQMNPSMVTSKRILFNEHDIAWMAAHLEPEYLIEFRLTEGVSPASLMAAYADAQLPARGPAIDGGSIRLLGGLSSTLIVGLVAVLALIIAAIGAVNVRLAIRTAVAADLGEIGTMKALGIPVRVLRLGHLAKYLAIAGAGTILGLAAAPLLHGPLTDAPLREMGAPASTTPATVAGLLAGVLVFLGAVGYSWLLTRPLKTIVPLDAMRATTTARRPFLWRWRLASSRLGPLPWLGARSSSNRGQVGLVGVFALVTVMSLIPSQIVTTFENPKLTSFFGVGLADILVESRDPAVAARVRAELPSDLAIDTHVSFGQERGQLLTPEGWEQLPVDVGDHSVFPIGYTDGTAPTSDDQISVSARVADDTGLTVGDTLVLRHHLGERTLEVTGIYQDITNGGRTAKGTWEVPDEHGVGWTTAVTVRGEPADVVDQWAGRFPGAAVVDVRTMGAEMMGGVLDMLRTVSMIALVFGALLILGLTLMYTRMLLTAEGAEWAALRAVGITDGRLRTVLMFRYGGLLALGVAVGALVAGLLGKFVLGGLAGSMLGAPELQLHGVPWLHVLALPILLAGAVAAGVAAGSRLLSTLSITTVPED